MKIFIKRIIALLTIILLRTIKSYFWLDNAKFKQLLSEKGFHLSIINHPQILFNGNRSRFVIYSNWWAKWVLKFFAYYLKQDCWQYCNSAILLKRIGLKQSFFCDLRQIVRMAQPLEMPGNERIDNKKVVIYSVMTGNYDAISDPVYISENCDYILFTDNANIQSQIWQIKLIEKSEDFPDKWYSRYYKMLAHKVLSEKYDYSIYVDAKILICGDIVQLINYLNKDCHFAVIKHHARCNIKQEMEYCIKKGKADEAETKRQYQEYIGVGFPDNIGLTDNCMLVRNHKDSELQKVMETWFDEFNKYPNRDQFSMMYSLWKNNMNNYRIIEGVVYSNQFMIEKKHLKI
jgi:hypothetical protein